MLRFKLLVSIVPLIAAAVIARVELSPSSRPCIAVGADSVELGSAPWHADLHVDFTDDPALATVRVALTDNPEDADFVVVDDSANGDDKGCNMPATQTVAIAADPTKTSPLIYLAQDGPADYHIFVRSSRFSAREAAALIVGAHAGGPGLVNASL
jgi:hypothetical protein